MIQIRKSTFESGFTLIELLVVISILGFLATTVLVGVNYARMKARNATRIGEYKKTVEALTLFRGDTGAYPVASAPGFFCLGPSTEPCWNNSIYGDDQLVSLLTPYLSRLPKTYFTSGYGQNRIMYWQTNIGSTKYLTLIWPYEGSMSSEVCPLFQFDLSAVTIYPPGVYGPDISVCYELHIYQ